MIVKGRMNMELLLDAILDSVKLVPFLYIVYLLIEYFEGHSDNRLYQKLSHTHFGGPILGALIGCVPQCGFSVVGANLYSKKMIGMGTLIAIFVSTSDEAIPILLAHPEMMGKVCLILALKVLIAIAVGLVIEGCVALFKGKRALVLAQGMTVTGDEDIQAESCGCGCHHEAAHENLWLIALKHTLRILVFIFTVNVVLNVLIEGVGEGALESVLLTNSIFQPALAALIGLIPNCAASIVLTEMFVAGSLSLGALIAGLSTGAGIGLVVLFKNNKNLKENLMIVGMLYGIGTLCGMLIQFFM